MHARLIFKQSTSSGRRCCRCGDPLPVKLKISGQQDAQGLEIPHRGRLERLFTSILAVAIGFNKSVALVIAVLKKKKSLG